jgi:N-acetylmuramoyl-L-alanine amidase
MVSAELRESFQRNEVALFIGAGLSMGASLPGWIELIRPLAQSVGSRWPDNESDLTTNHLLIATQHYENRQGRHALISHLCGALDTSGMQPTSVHEFMALLPVRIIFTTNYDNLIEQALRQAGKHPTVIVEESELAFWREDSVNLVKLCGDLDRPASIVITQRDFNTYFPSHPRLAERLRATLEIKTALFLGYSLQDPFFNQIWDHIGLDFGKLRRWAYAVLFDADALTIDDLHQRSIHVINLETKGRDRSIVLSEWLQELLTKTNLLSESDVPLSPKVKSEAEIKGDGAPTSSPSIYGTGNRWAVLVGVNEYQDMTNYGKLHVCVKDVYAIYKQLIAGGFDTDRIRLLIDDSSELPTRENILVALKSVADATEPDDLLLFYYSGHGDETDGESYLVAHNGRRLVLRDTAVSVSRVKEIMEQAPARAKVIFLDACHSGADIGGKGPKPMSEEFIRRVFEQAEGLVILASCKQGQLSYEWRVQERSVFTHFLLEALSGQADRDEKGFVTIQDANRHVVNGVKLWASQHNVSQTPTLQAAVAGDIILCNFKLSDES